jgi:hypothetical protein
MLTSNRNFPHRTYAPGNTLEATLMRKESIVNQLGPHAVNHMGEAPHKLVTTCEEPDTPQITKLPLRSNDNFNSGDHTEYDQLANTLEKHN